jgi:hypothetical protein
VKVPNVGVRYACGEFDLGADDLAIGSFND